MNEEPVTMNSNEANKIRIRVLVSEACSFAVANAGILARLALFPFAASFVVFIIDNSLPNASWVYLLSLIIKFCAMGMFAVAVHRFYILSEAPKIRLGLKETKFILVTVLSVTLWVVPLEFSIFVFDQHVEALHNNEQPSPISFLGAFAFVCILYFALLRLSLVFPLIAIAKQGSIGSHINYSWQKMRGHVLTFFLSAGVLALVIGLFSGLPEIVLDSVYGEERDNFILLLITGSISLCTDFINSLFLVLFVSYIFKKTKPAGLN